jgi:hypothetical protein
MRPVHRELQPDDYRDDTGLRPKARSGTMFSCIMRVAILPAIEFGEARSQRASFY